MSLNSYAVGQKIMHKRLMKVSGSGASSAALGSPGTLVAVALGICTVVGISSFHKHKVGRHQNASNSSNDASRVQTGLVRVHVPRNFRDLVKNDVLLEQSIHRVSQTLLVFVDGADRHEIVNYTSELYALVWDILCTQGRPLLDVKIIGGFTSPPYRSWEELVELPELNAVFGEDAYEDVQRLNAKRFEHDGLYAVTYHPLAIHIERRLGNDLHYFEDESQSLTPNDTAILGGTFDHLHNGHKKLLSLALSVCKRKMVVGVTSDALLQKKKYAHLIESIVTRKQKVESYLRFLRPNLELEIVTIEDPFGPAITIPYPAALIVSSETISGARKINDIRRERQLPDVSIYVCRRTESSTLSSTFIRSQLA